MEKQALKIGTTGFCEGWHEGVSMGKYLADPAVSASKLWTLHNLTPGHLRDELEEETEDTTDPQDLGNVTHTAVFEPDVFDDRYVVLGRCEGRKTDGKRCSNPGVELRGGQAFCGIRAHTNGQPIDEGVYTIGDETKAAARAMRDALMGYRPTATILQAPGPREVTGIWEDPVTGLMCRIRPDQLILDPDELEEIFWWSPVNLKTLGVPVKPGESLWRHLERFGTVFKAGFYRLGIRALWGVEPQNFLYPCVESSSPYAPILYRMLDDILDAGEEQARDALNRLASCIEHDRWETYPERVHDLHWPGWKERQLAQMPFVETDEPADYAGAA